MVKKTDIPVITGEVRGYKPNTVIYYDDKPKPKLSREIELRAHAEALLRAFLENPAKITRDKNMQ